MIINISEAKATCPNATLPLQPAMLDPRTGESALFPLERSENIR